MLGGAKGLGREIALELAKAGFSVAVHYLSLDEEAENTASDCKEFGVQAKTIISDLSTVDGAVALAEKVRHEIGSIYGIVNCVGQSVFGSVLETPLEKAEQLFAMNLFVPIALIRELIEDLKRERGAVVHIETLKILGGSRPYCEASKEALIRITRSLALELVSYGVRVNMISSFESSSLTLACPPTDQALAQTAVYLISEQASSITGQHIEAMRGAT